MPFDFPVRRNLAVVAITAAALLASCATPPPPPPPPPPPVSLSSKLIEDASAYRAYVTQAAEISPAFTDGPSVAASLRKGASYKADQLLRGAIAYGAVAALQDTAFVEGVRLYVKDPAQRQDVAAKIMREPSYVVGITGSASAAALVQSALAEDGRRLVIQGRLVKQAAYDVQHSAWSKSDVAGRDARLNLAKQLSATPAQGEPAETARLQQASTGAQPLGLTPGSIAPPYTPLVVRSLAVAALAALGYGDDATAQVAALATDTTTGSCLNMAKLNLYQCLAVSKPHYEDVFCLGVHAMQDTGACLMQGAGVAVPPDPAVEAAKAAAAKAKLTPVSTKAKAKAKTKRAKR